MTLPNYVGQKASEAKSALEKLGFSVKISSQLTLDSSQDKKVASQDPVGGTEVHLRQEDGTPTTVTLKMYSSCSKSSSVRLREPGRNQASSLALSCSLIFCAYSSTYS